MTRLSDN